MRPAARPSTPEDGPAIAELLRQAGLRPNLEPESLHWKYWQKRDDWPGSRSFVLARGTELLAHAGIVPGMCAWAGSRVRVIHMIDWAARPDVAGAGVSLMKYISRLADLLLSIGGSAQTRAILPFLGFRPYGVATGYVRVLRPSQILKDRTQSRWRLIPRFARSGLWSLTAPRYGGDGWHAELIDQVAAHSLAACFPIPRGDMAVFERTEALFRYALRCPIALMELYSISRGGPAKGYFLLAFAPAQVRLVDCWIDSADPADWRALIEQAVRQARGTPGAAELVALASDPTLSQALLKSGFHARRMDPIQLLPSGRIDGAPATLRVQMLDSDSAYHHSGQPAFWA
jgi:hypothetical protein